MTTSESTLSEQGGGGWIERHQEAVWNLVDDHPWVGILGHPDDDECSECGEPEHRHLESTR